MARYHNPKTGKTVEAKNIEEAMKLMKATPPKMKTPINKPIEPKKTEEVKTAKTKTLS